MKSSYVQANGIRIHVLTDGPKDGEPVLLIHGFPETSYEWRKTIPALAYRYRVIAPDTRGFGKTDKPDGRYSRRMLAADMIGVLDAMGIERANVAGHDWGGIIAFKVAIDWPQRTSKLALMDTLCTVWTPGARHGFWFKARPLPEDFFAEYHQQFIEQIFTGKSNPPLPPPPASPWVGPSSVARSSSTWATPEDVRTYKRAFRDPASHAAAISYYRHALPFHRVTPDRRSKTGERIERFPAPDVAKIWRAGSDNHPLGREFFDYGPEDRYKRYPGPALWMYADPQKRLEPGHQPRGNPFFDQFPRYFPDLRAEPVPGAGHFFPEERPAFTNRRLLRFLAGRDR